MCTAYLWLEPTVAECGPGLVRHEQNVKCKWCDKTYAVDYESSCSDPRELAVILHEAQRVIDEEHLTGLPDPSRGHRRAKIEVPMRILQK